MSLQPQASPRLTERIVVGVDLAAGRGITAMAALRVTTTESTSLATLALLSVESMADDEAIIARVARVAPSIIALDAPLSLPAAVASALRGEAAPSGASPYTRAAERDPIWSRLGVRPFPVSFLGGLTFRAIPLAARLRAQQPAARVIEVFPSATLAALGQSPAPPLSHPRPRKTAPVRRRATQQALARYVAGLTQPADTELPLDADYLDAILAALTAAAAMLGAAHAIGEAEEGSIIVPAPNALHLFRPIDDSRPTE